MSSFLSCIGETSERLLNCVKFVGSVPLWTGVYTLIIILILHLSVCACVRACVRAGGHGKPFDLG